jgi:hypothetical protein
MSAPHDGCSGARKARSRTRGKARREWPGKVCRNCGRRTLRLDMTFGPDAKGAYPYRGAMALLKRGVRRNRNHNCAAGSVNVPRSVLCD